MKTIDITTPKAAIAYLRSLPADAEIELPGAHDSRVTSPAVDAVSVIAGESPNSFGIGYNRWNWTAGELVKVLAAFMDSTTED